MSAVLEAREPSARYLVAERPALVQQFELLATAQGAVSRLRELILGLAVQGKLVHQDARDEPASDLLERIAAERARLIAAGKLRQSKDSTEKDSPEPPYLLPRGWAWSRLASIGVINPRNDAADDVVASFVQMSSIPVAFNALHDTEARPWRDIKSGFTQFADGDVGVAKITPCFENGKSTVFQNLSNGIGAGTTELHIVRPLCGVAPRYVLLFLKSPRFLREGEATMTGTAGQKRLPRSFFENCPFPLPPLAEQARIVARVDELMRLCDALEAKGRLEAEQHARLLDTLLGTLTDSSTPEELAANWQRVADHFDLLLDRPEAVDALEQTVLQLAVRGLLVPQDPCDEPASLLVTRILSDKEQLISEGKIKRDKPLPSIDDGEAPFELPSGWNWVRLGSIAGVERGGSPRPIEAFLTDSPEGLNWIKIGDTEKGGKYITSTREKIRSEGLSKTRKVYPGDFLLTNSMSFGRPYITQIEGCIHDGWLRISPPSSLDKNYLYLLLSSSFMRELFIAAAAGGVVQNLNADKVRGVPIPMPPLAEQARIVTRAAELRRLCVELRQRLERSSAAQAALAEALIDQALAA